MGPTRCWAKWSILQNAAEWRSFCGQVLRQPGLVADARFADNEARVRNRPALDAEIRGVFAGLSRQALVARLREGGIGYGFVNSVADFCRHPQLRRAPVSTPGGTIDLVAPPLRHAGVVAPLRPVPALGEHSSQLLREFAGRADCLAASGH